MKKMNIRVDYEMNGKQEQGGGTVFHITRARRVTSVRLETQTYL